MWRTELFKRASDGLLIEPGRQTKLRLERDVDEQWVQQFDQSGAVFATSGKVTAAGMIFLQFVRLKGMNHVLGPVRNLQILTHIMMMTLVYPECSEPFFAQLFEFITYDMYNTDNMYDEMFGFEHVPFNEFADAIGYPSRFLIFNSGSMTVFLWITILTQFFVIPLILCCCKSTRCCHKYA